MSVKDENEDEVETKTEDVEIKLTDIQQLAANQLVFISIFIVLILLMLAILLGLTLRPVPEAETCPVCPPCELHLPKNLDESVLGMHKTSFFLFVFLLSWILERGLYWSAYILTKLD